MATYNYQVPTWTIDWVNKIFTLLNSPDTTQMLNVWMDWAIYTAFTIVWTTLTLTDAPEYSLLISYSTTDANPTTTSTDTLWDIITEVWDLLWQTSNSTIFSRPKVVKKVNAKIREVLRGRVTSLLDPNRIYRVWKIWYMESKTWFRIQWNTILTDALSVWDIIAKCDTSLIYPAWYMQVWSDVINYTSVTSTQLEWVTWITVTHNTWDKLVQLYEMPSNFEKPNEVIKIVQWDTLKVLPIPYDPNESMAYCYNIYKIWNITLLKVIWLTNDDLVQVSYTRKFYNLVDDSDICPLPDDYWTEVIAPLVAWWYASKKWFPISSQVLVDAYTNLQNMYQFISNEITITKQNISPQSYWFNSLQGFNYLRRR